MQPELFAQAAGPGAGSAYADFARRLRASDCRLCPLHAGRSHIVVDRGSPQARILVIGEAPGESEDREGRAFVGRAGKTFDRVMASIGMDTNRDMLICNVVKCRPPRNRPPKREEAEACRPFLEEQMRIVRPRVVLLLGATALRRLRPELKTFSMEGQVGRFFELDAYPGVLFMAFYHPAALLYNSSLKSAMLDHARKLKRCLDSGFSVRE